MSAKNPKGKLIAIGGAVDKGIEVDSENSGNLKSEFLELGILKHLLEELTGSTKRIEIITTASQIPEITGQNYLDAFKRLGNKNVGVMHIKEREDTLIQKYLERIQKAEGILLTGGNQLRLTTILGGTEFLKILLNKYQNEKFVVAGTSAGAMHESSRARNVTCRISRPNSSAVTCRSTLRCCRSSRALTIRSPTHTVGPRVFGK